MSRVITSATGEAITFDQAAESHIESQHPEFVGYLWVVEMVAQDPGWVVPSQQFPNCEVYMEYGAHPKYPYRYVAVVVETDPKPARIVTAYTQKRLKGWQKGARLYERQ